MGSYPGNGGHFNPSSYTRQFLGSPLSWRPGSFGGRVYLGSSPGMCFDSDDFKSTKMSSSIESDRGSVINALNAFEQQGDLCKNYSCCGKELPDLHALVDHFEDVHVVVFDPLKPQIPYPNPNAAPYSESIQTPAFPSTTPTQAQPNPTPSYFPESAPLQQHAYQTGPFDPDDMELDEPHQSSHSTPSSGAPTPPDTPISTPLSSYIPAASGYISQPASPHIQFGEAAFDTTTVLPRHKNVKHHPNLADVSGHALSVRGCRAFVPSRVRLGRSYKIMW
jgi:transcription factor SFP1